MGNCTSSGGGGLKGKLANAISTSPEVDDFHPYELGGTTRSKDSMTFAEADTNRANPHFYSDPLNEVNCQSCVVVHEARLRGYDVIALPKNATSDLVAKDRALAYIDPKTGKKPDVDYLKDPKVGYVNTPNRAYKALDSLVKQGERYEMGFTWKDESGGHRITVSRNSSGQLRLFDPQRPAGQRDTWTGAKEITEYFKRVKYRKGEKVYGVGVLRVDDKQFNKYICDKIMRGAK